MFVYKLHTPVTDQSDEWTAMYDGLLQVVMHSKHVFLGQKTTELVEAPGELQSPKLDILLLKT